jgi:hypothetical protein
MAQAHQRFGGGTLRPPCISGSELALFPLFRFFRCGKYRCNECAPCAINSPARFPYSTVYEAILSRKGNNVATTPLKALGAFLFLLDIIYAVIGLMP